MNVLAQIEKETGLPPRKIAEMLDITKSYYSMVRNNKRQISKTLALKMYKVFNVPLEDTLSRPAG